MKRLYVAGSSGERARASSFMDHARIYGHSITYDWVRAMRAVEDEFADLREWELPSNVRLDAALADLGAVGTSDLLIVLVPEWHNPTRGAWIEYGYAIGRGIPVWIVGTDTRIANCTIFTEIAQRKFTSDEEALEALMREAHQ